MKRAWSRLEMPWETDLSARDDSLKEESAGGETERRKDPKL